MITLKSAVKIIGKIIFILVGLFVLLAFLGALIFSSVDKTNGRLISSGQERKYLLFVPESYNPSNPTPLVISIHGFAEWPAHQMDLSGWNRLADEHGFIVVYPSGSGFPKRWVINSQSGTPSERLVDVRFISDLIDKLSGEYNIDSSRIYANGLSNGGGMSALLACELSERIAAVGGVSGAYLFSPDDCNPSRPVPMIAFHGTADPIVPYQGGPSSSFDIPFPAVPAWIEVWAGRNGCSLPPVELTSQGEVSGVQYTGCEQNAQVVFYTIEGGGHSWPGGDPLPQWIVGHTTQDVDATQLMWEFFRQYSLDR
jgi:polyhydroxybutyrate depolymerase